MGETNINNNYKIVFDTNFVYYDKSDELDSVFNSSLLDIKKFLDKHNLSSVSLSVPNIVIEERLSQRVENIRAIIESVDSAVKKFNVFNIKVDLKKIKSKKYREALRTKSNKFLSVNSIGVIKTAKKNQDILLDRAFKRMKPFAAGDKGFKDTLIWLSILEDAKKNKDKNYIFCTKNINDFVEDVCRKEFKKFSDNNFKIIKEADELKEYLDEKLVLNLELRKLHERIEEELRQKLGTITMQTVTHISKLSNNFYKFQNNGLSMSDNFFVNTSNDIFVTASEKRKEESLCYDFEYINFTNITQQLDDTYYIEADLRLREMINKTSASLVTTYYNPIHDCHSESGKSRLFRVDLIYDRPKKVVTVTVVHSRY